MIYVMVCDSENIYCGLVAILSHRFLALCSRARVQARPLSHGLHCTCVGLRTLLLAYFHCLLLWDLRWLSYGGYAVFQVLEYHPRSSCLLYGYLPLLSLRYVPPYVYQFVACYSAGFFSLSYSGHLMCMMS